MELEVRSQVGKEVEQEVGCHQGVPVELDLKPHSLPMPVSTCGLHLPPIFAVSELALFLHAICDVPLLPHPVEAAVELAARSSKHYASAACISHHAVKQHPWQPVYLYAGEAAELVEEQEVAEEVQEDEVQHEVEEAMEEVQVHIE